MIQKFKNFHQKLKVFVVEVLFKKFFVPWALICTYFFILGPTSIIARIFFRKKLIHDSGSSESSWMPARDYETTLKDSLHQS